MKIYFFVLMILMVQCLFGQVASDAPIDWTNAGYRGNAADIPRQFDRIVDVKTEFDVKGDGITNDAPEIQRAINAYSDFAVYYFRAGTYYLGSTITLRSNCVIRGAGSSNTVFKITHSNSVFSIAGSSEVPIPASIPAELVKDAQTISLPFPGSAGDFIEISAHDPSLVVAGDEAAWNYCIGQVVRVRQAAGSTVILDDKLRLNYSNRTTRIAKMHNRMNVGFENFKVSNQSPAGSLNFSTNFNFNCAADCWVYGVESQGSGLAHVMIGSSANIEIHGCYFHEAQEYGEGGHGYGVCIGGHSSSCLIENSIFRILRHAMILAGGANGNVFGYNYSRDVYSSWEPDLSFHGHYPFANLFEGNSAEFAQADLVWGVNGPYNAIFRNMLNRIPVIMCWGIESKEGGIRIDHQSGFSQHFYLLGNAVRDVDCVFGSHKNALYFDWADLDLEGGNTGLDEVTDGSFSNGERTSYYKGSRPDFISAAYTWPPLGCKFSGSIPSRTIPAKDRWFTGGGMVIAPPAITNILTVQASAGTNGKLNPSGSIAVTPGSDQTFTVEPESGHIIADVLVDGKSVGPLTRYTFNDVMGDHRISVSFGDLPAVHAIAGTVTYANGAARAIGGAAITLAPTTGTALSTTSAANGTFTIPNLPSGTYTLSAKKTGTWGGVNAADALGIIRHAKGIAPLAGLAAVAGDVDNSGTIDTADAYLIARRGAGLADIFTAGDWVFASQQVVVGAADVPANITGLAVGDVNASYQPSSGVVFAKSAPSIILNTNPLKKAAPVGIFEIPVRGNSEFVFGAVSVKINFPAGMAELISISTKLSGFVSRSDEGSVTIEWFDGTAKNPAMFNAGEILVTLKFSPKVSGGTFEITLDPGSEFADAEGNLISTAHLSAPTVEISNIPAAFALEQNYPNPFNPTTAIRFQLSANSYTTLKIFDVIGREISTLISETLPAGTYTHQWNATNMPSGVYYYRLQAGSLTETKKLILVR